MQEHNEREAKRKALLLIAASLVIIFLAVSIKPTIDANAIVSSLRDSPSFNIHEVIFFAVLAFTIAGLILAFNNERKYRQAKQDLGEYIAECERRGYSIEEITNLLEKKGWIKKDIERFV